jgi:hypothetical protein
MRRLTASPRVREAGLFLLRVAALGSAILVLKDPKARAAAFNQLGQMARQLIG